MQTRVLSKKLFVLAVTTVALTLGACATKESKPNIQRAGNRKAGLMIQKITLGGASVENPDFRMYFNDLIVRSIKEVYGSDVQLLNLTPGNLIESPDSLFLLAANEIDDLFLSEVNLPNGFVIPPELDLSTEGRSEEEKKILMQANRVEISSRVINGSNLRTVTILKASAPLTDRKEFEASYVASFKENAMQVFPNPNLYPESNPGHFANLLYQFSQKRERENLNNLTCDNAGEILNGYAQARDLYEKAKAKGIDASVGQQEEAMELNNRLDDSIKKAKILKACQEDNLRGFQLDYEFQKIDVSNQNLIKQALKKARLEELLAQYSNKPVLLSFTVAENGELSLELSLRYDRSRYLAWNKKLNTPPRVGNYHIVSLEPYHSLMKTMIFLRTALPPESPQGLATPFSRMNMTLILSTLLNGQMSVGVNGRTGRTPGDIELFFPNSLRVEIPSYEALNVLTRSEELFQEKGWISLSSCKTVDGTMTEDGLVMQFLGLPCVL